jgi:hypothetical protein
MNIRTQGQEQYRSASGFFGALCDLETGEPDVYWVHMKTQEMTNRIHDIQKRIGDTAKNVGTATDGYVHENAWKSVALAAAVGCLLGFLLGHRGRD